VLRAAPADRRGGQRGGIGPPLLPACFGTVGGRTRSGMLMALWQCGSGADRADLVL